MTQQIQTTFSQPVDFIPQIRNATENSARTSNLTATSSSARSTMRRMRTETTTTSWSPWTTDSTTTWPSSSFGALDKDKEALNEAFVHAVMKKNYAEVLSILSNMETQCDHVVERVEFIVENLLQAQFTEARAYFLGMMKNPEAINLCDAGAEQLKQSLSEAMELVHELGLSPRVSNFSEILDAVHLFYRGFLELSVGQREAAIHDIRSALLTLNFQEDWEELPYCADPEALFFIKILEQKLGVSLFPIPQTIDATNPNALFVAGQYKEALVLLEPLSDYRDTHMPKAACLAMLGRIDEAKECLEDANYSTSSTDYTSSTDCTHPLLDFLEGNYKKLEDVSLNWNRSPVLLMLPLAVKGLES